MSLVTNLIGRRVVFATPEGAKLGGDEQVVVNEDGVSWTPQTGHRPDQLTGVVVGAWVGPRRAADYDILADPYDTDYDPDGQDALIPLFLVEVGSQSASDGCPTAQLVTMTFDSFRVVPSTGGAA